MTGLASILVARLGHILCKTTGFALNRQLAARFAFDFFGPLPIEFEVSDAPLTSDAGLLPIRPFDQRIGLTRAFAQALDDPRDPDLTEHTFLEMVRARVEGILAGYANQNDHGTLRADPVFKLLADCWGVGGLPVEEYRRQAGARSPG
jgi:hypothetical protein